MRRLFQSLLTLTLALLLARAPLRAAEDVQPVIVKFRGSPAVIDRSAAADSARREQRSRFNDDLPGLTSRPEHVRYDFRRVFNGVALDVNAGAIASIRALPYVEAVYPDVKVHATLLDSAPLIGADRVWTQYGITGLGIRVAIVDTGIAYTHPDLGGCFGAACKVVGGYDFVNHDSDPADDQGHGTHVAGIVAANGVVRGIAPDAKLLAYKVLDSNGNGLSSTIIAGIDAAVDPDGNPATSDGARVINLSLGGSGDPDDPMSQAVDNATARGVVVVVAAGNAGPNEQSIGSPGTARQAITVGASDKSDRLANFSSRGPVIWDGGAILKPDIVAPGVAICSTRWDSSSLGSTCIDATHMALSGTSMATPHIAGVAALLLQKNPSWTPADVKAALRVTALDLAQPPTVQGYGRVRALSAIQLAHAPPTASIATSGTPTGVLDIKGTATSPTFQRYTLSIGAGLDPAAWTTIATSTQPVTNGVLAAGFDPLARPDDIYTLRLVVTDSSNLSSEDRTFIRVKNVEVTTPLGTDSYRAGTTIDIRGAVPGGSQFDHYVIEYGAGYSPTEWRTAGITLANGGSVPVTNGSLGRWNTSGLAPGVYVVRVVVTSDWGTSVTTVEAIYLDPRLKPGWPVRVPYDVVPEGAQLRTSASVYTFPASSTSAAGGLHGTKTVSTSSPEFAELAKTYYWGGLLAPVVSDLDHSGTAEIIVVQGGVPPKLRVYGSGGKLRWSNALGTSAVTGGNLGMPAVADIDNDGREEIVVAVPHFETPQSLRLFAFHSDGTNVTGFPVVLAMDFDPSIAIADVDGDGYKDIVVQGNSGNPRKMTIVGHTGNVLSQWTLPVQHASAAIVSTPAVGNFDEDPQLEIVVAEPSEFAGYDSSSNTWNNTGVIHVFNLDGSEVSGWPRFTQGITFSSPVVADIDGDGHEDVIVGHMYNSSVREQTLGGVEIYDRHGISLPGWPALRGAQFWSTPAVGDLDGDGVPEIAISDLENRAWILHADGTAARSLYMAWSNYHSTAIADVDGDGAPDVLATAGNGYMGGGVYAWTASGVPIAGFPLYTDVDAQAGPTIADIDGDGKVEIIASSDQDLDQTTGIEKLRGSVYVWDLAAPYRASATPWPHFHHDATHAGRFEGRCLAVSLSPSEQLANLLPATRDYTLTLRSIDARCEPRAWPLSASVPAGWSANLSNPNPTVPLGSTVNVKVTVIAPAGTQQGNYPVRVTVSGDATHPAVEPSATFVLDLTAPTVTIKYPAAGATYLQNRVVRAAYSCADAETSVLSCVGTQAVGSPLPTSTTGTKSFTVTAIDRAGNATSKTVNYTVVASSPSYSLSTTSLAFGSQALNLVRARTVTLRNDANAALPITSIAVSGTNAQQFAQTNNCGSSVPQGASCTITVTFKPTSTGSKAASLNVTAGTVANTKSVSLSGTGVRSTFSVTPAAIDFGNVARNSTSAATSVTISNTGTVVLPVASITIVGANPGMFAKTSHCPAQVAVGSSCTVSVVFKPIVTGPLSASLKITPGGGAPALYVALNGTGT